MEFFVRYKGKTGDEILVAMDDDYVDDTCREVTEEEAQVIRISVSFDRLEPHEKEAVLEIWQKKNPNTYLSLTISLDELLRHTIRPTWTWDNTSTNIDNFQYSAPPIFTTEDVEFEDEMEDDYESSPFE